MIDIRIHDQEVFQLLRQLEQKLDDMKPAMVKIAGIMHDAVEENYEREGRPRWPALADATIAQRIRRGHWPGKILQATGKLAASWTQRAERTRAIVGSNYPLALYHEKGTRHMPARPVLKLTARDIGEIKMVLMGYLFRN